MSRIGRMFKTISLITVLILLLVMAPRDTISALGPELVPIGDTVPTPVVSMIYTASVIENYDYEDPVIIAGEGFQSVTIAVYFDNTEARKVSVQHWNDGTSFLEAYLPTGRNKLEPGIYDITVRNDKNHSTTIAQAFSVIRAGDEVPEEDIFIKGRHSKGTIFASAKASEDTIELRTALNDSRNVNLDLDDLMGEDVLIRNVSITGRTGRLIEKLEASSKWADIVFYRLTLSPFSDGRQINLNLGRVETFMSGVLKNKLRNRSIKSEFIRADGENMRFQEIWLRIPYRESDGTDIEVIRYDEASGQWHEVLFNVNYVDRAVEVESSRAGVFVVVEREAENEEA